MSTGIDPATVRRIGHLARLKLTDPEVERFAGQLSSILGYMDQLNRIDTASVESTAHPLPIHTVLRDDVPTEPLGAECLLASAPRHEAGCFALPKVLEQESA